jgi:hypothetical protein
MKFTLIILFTLAAIVATSQTLIKSEDVSKHVNDSITVCGKVAGGRYMDQSQSGLTLLNVGGAFPNQVFTIAIGNDLRSQFEIDP